MPPPCRNTLKSLRERGLDCFGSIALTPHPRTLPHRRHPLIKSLKEKFAANAEDASAQEAAKLLYETALLESGFVPEDPKVRPAGNCGRNSKSAGHEL